MKCPHCLENFHAVQAHWSVALGGDKEGSWVLERKHCPSCGRFIFAFRRGAYARRPIPSQGTQGDALDVCNFEFQAWPKGIARAPISKEVPRDIAQDYTEACLVLADSPKASAALSRRCLQNLLRKSAGVTPANLSGEIQQVLDSKQLPSPIAESIDAVRNIGNFAAHPIKSTTTGEIVDVEPHEAEWNLDVLESLFDFYYVLPAKAKAKKDALNKKLGDAGKPAAK